MRDQNDIAVFKTVNINGAKEEAKDLINGGKIQ
jgi:hypothetical protein